MPNNDYDFPNFEQLMGEMMSTIPNTLDKREGSMIYNAVAPAAAELSQLYIQLGWTLDQSFPDTAERHNLVRRAIERGIRPFPATASVLRAVMVPATVQLPQGARFNLDEINYTVIENEETPGSYKMRCEETGTIGNRENGDLIPIEYISGLESATVTALLIPGEDDEPTEAFRQRYMDSFSGMAYGGNIADYQGKVLELTGVGAVKVIPIWDGGGTVKLILLGGDYSVPSAELVQSVQNAIDPILSGGKGSGIAPVGHRVTVQGAEAQTIDINMFLTLSDGVNFLDIKSQIETRLRDYFRAETTKWDKRDVSVRVSQIMYHLFRVEQVRDIKYVTINGQPEDLVLAQNKVPILGTVDNTGSPLKKV